jgi:magnesium-transporting ATPase (P-type)
VLIFFCLFFLLLPFLASGSTIAEGSCHMLALRVGSNFEGNETLKPTHTDQELEIPLQKKLKRLTFLISIISLSVFIVESNIFNVRFNFC